MKKKGISPVIATVLLIAIVIVIATIIFIWASSFGFEEVQKFGSNIENACGDIDLEVEKVESAGVIEIVNRGDVAVYNINIIADEGGDEIVYECDNVITQGDTEIVDPSSDCYYSGSLEDIISVVPVLLGNAQDGSTQEYICESNEFYV